MSEEGRQDRERLEAAGYALRGNVLRRGEERYLPLYEAKMMRQFTHRWATYEKNGKTREMTAEELRDPHCLPLPRYWVHERDVEARRRDWTRKWFISFRSIARATDERTMIAAIIPYSAVSGKLPLIFPEDESPDTLLANLNSFVLDYVARQKIGGTDMAFFYLKQLPAIPPHTYFDKNRTEQNRTEQNRTEQNRTEQNRTEQNRTEQRTSVLIDFIRPRVLELTYTAWDLQPFARDLGYDGAPFVWDEQRRSQLRCELDALYFHLYGIERGDLEYIMETFPIVRRKEQARYGEYRSKRVILEMYDAMSDLPRLRLPAPHDPSESIDAPDVSAWSYG